MNTFSKGDIVQCSDKNSRAYMDGGVVTEVAGDMCRVQLYLANRNIPFHNDQLILIQPASASKVSNQPIANPSGVTCHIQIGDDVKYIGSDKKMVGARGKVLNIYKIVVPTGKDYLAALVCVQWGNEEIPCDSLLAIAPMGGSHYQAVVDSDGPKYDSYSDQDISNHEKEPFRHTDLGTDLSGDELMDSIRSICGR